MVEIEPPPEGCTYCHDTLLTPGAVAFVSSLVEAFSSQVDDVRCLVVLLRACVERSCMAANSISSIALCCLNIFKGTSRVPVEGKSSVCVICMKYRIIFLIIIIIGLGQIILSYMANTSCTHARMHTCTHTEGKSSVCVICMKYWIIILIIIIISLGQIILSYMANTSCTHARMYACTHTEGKSSVCVICMKYWIIVLIIIIISLHRGQIILAYMANTSRTHVRTHTHAHTHSHAHPPAAVTIQVVAVPWVGVHPTMAKICPLFACSAGHEWPVGASFK